jgi:hypothetical protein
MNPRVFREYDIRGEADRDLKDDFVTDLGRALGAMWRESTDREKPIVAIGRDCRVTSDRIFAALVRGVTGMGVSVVGHAHSLLCAVPLGSRRCPDHHWQPQPIAGQRLQDSARQVHHSWRRHSCPAHGHRVW